MHLELWQLGIVLLGAYIMGLSKTGVAGLGIVAVALFAVAMPARASTGVLLPILVCSDVVAVLFYRRHAVWGHLWRLFPWAALGVVLGWLAMKQIDDKQLGHFLGLFLILITLHQGYRRRRATPLLKQTDDLEPPDTSAHRLLAAGLGVMAGFTTMIANAAGPLMVLYLLSARLPKMEFVGTAAWYFLVLNLFKVPFSMQLGLINFHSCQIDLLLAPVAVIGALTGRVLLRYIDQKVFEASALVLALAAGIKLLFV